MESVGIAQLKARLSEFLDLVRAGDQVLVTDRGRPLARIVPAARTAGHDADSQRLDELERGGLIRRAERDQVVGTFWVADRPADPQSAVLDTILAERA